MCVTQCAFRKGYSRGGEKLGCWGPRMDEEVDLLGDCSSPSHTLELPWRDARRRAVYTTEVSLSGNASESSHDPGIPL